MIPAAELTNESSRDTALLETGTNRGRRVRRLESLAISVQPTSDAIATLDAAHRH